MALVREHAEHRGSELYWLSVFPHLPHSRIGIFISAPVVLG
ncbi:hypothetical protein ACVWXU_000211 [Streptomyces sp. TE33382]